MKLIAGFLGFFSCLICGLVYFDITQPKSISDLTQPERDAVKSLEKLKLRVRTPGGSSGGGFGAPTLCLALVDQPVGSTQFHLVELELRTYQNEHEVNLTPIIEHLKNFPHLKRLVLPGCHVRQRARIKQLLPKCDVYSNYKDYRLKHLASSC